MPAVLIAGASRGARELPQRLDAVVNNAGVVVAGPAIPLAELRRQLEVNVVGQVAVTQAVLPRLRVARGRIVFVSSVSGRASTPMFGPYRASKFALEAMADPMRMELRPWGSAPRSSSLPRPTLICGDTPWTNWTAPPRSSAMSTAVSPASRAAPVNDAARAAPVS